MGGLGRDRIRISVIMPAYNVEPFIRRALDSALAQTRPPDEIIVVDAESTDKTAEIVKSYGDRVRYIWQRKEGISVGRNDGIKAAQYEWVALLDADDEWLPGFLEKQTAILECDSGLVWTCGNFWIHNCENGKRRAALDPTKAEALLGGKKYFDSYLEAAQQGFRSQTSGYIIQRQVIEKVGMFRVGQMVAEDTDLFWRISYRWPKVGYLPEPLSVYYSHRPGGITQQYKGSDIRFHLIKEHIQMAADHGKSVEFRPVAAKVMGGWFRAATKDDRIFGLRPLIREYHQWLTRGERMRLWLVTLFPHITRNWHRLKRRLKGR